MARARARPDHAARGRRLRAPRETRACRSADGAEAYLTQDEPEGQQLINARRQACPALEMGFLERPIGARALEIQRGIQRQFDPLAILNPGKVFHARG